MLTIKQCDLTGSVTSSVKEGNDNYLAGLLGDKILWSWYIGSNENANGLLREFFPKKTDLARVSEKEIDEALLLINHRPRKCLGWKTSFELFHEKLSHLY